MSDLSTKEKRKLEAFFEMGGGYYLDFSNRTITDFVADTIDVDFYSDRYNQGSGSKANRVRAIWDLESNHVVGKLIRETIEHDDDERLINTHLPKRDAVLKSHCLQIAKRLESGNSFQPQGGFSQPQPQPAFKPQAQGGFPQPQPQGQPAFKPQAQGGFSQPQPQPQGQPAFKPQAQGGFSQPQPQPQGQPAFKPQVQGGFKPQRQQQATNSVRKNKVFIVHGHDELVRERIARFISQVGLEPIILFEQTSSSRTIIEKFEKYAAEVCFAVVAYTPCDQGSKMGESNQLPRARQNVVFEHGYFIGALGRENVIALVKGDLEQPNDISGVVYEKFDESGAWKLKLAQEMKVSGCQIDMNNII